MLVSTLAPFDIPHGPTGPSRPGRADVRDD
jgi:hypothetical protein